MNAIVYLYWRLVKQNAKSNPNDPWLQKVTAYIQLMGLFSLHLMSFVFIVDSYFKTNIRTANGWIGDNSFENRFYKIPLLLMPFFIAIVVFFRMNKERIRQRMNVLDQIPIEERKKKNRLFLLYIVLSVLFFILSITSSSWF